MLPWNRWQVIKRYKSSLKDVATVQEYLDYCSENQKDVSSTTFRGTLYELYAKEFLEKSMYCYDMNRVGGAGDNGIDLVGRWDLSRYWNRLSDEKKLQKYPRSALLSVSKQHSDATDSGRKILVDLESQIQILAQCKNYKKRIQASTIRELGGIYDYHARTAMDRMRTFFFLMSPFPLTNQAQRQFDSSKIPLIHYGLPHLFNQEDEVRIPSQTTIYMNPKARQLLEGIENEILKG